jgi:thiosulfate/3-mercaptopyruvate sulfurtransferase
LKVFIKVFLLTVITITYLNSASTQKKDLPSIVEEKWLLNNLDKKNVVIVDLRKYDEYKKGHIKGAVNIPGLKNLFDDKFFMPKLDFLQEVLSQAGISKDSLVVAYDDGAFFWAARFYWILEILGHNNVGLLKVSYPYWKNKNYPISTKIEKPKRTNFVPRVDSSKIETKLSTLMAIGKKTIIDGRKSSHYEGKESLTKRYGHIPTAKNYACTQNYQVSSNGNKMKDLTVLAKVYKDIPKNKPIILYCDAGAEAALNYIVLKELGYNASVYDGSWIEWGNDKNLPVENPSKKDK